MIDSERLILIGERLQQFISSYHHLRFSFFYHNATDTVWFIFTDIASEPNWTYKHIVDGDRLFSAMPIEVIIDEITTGFYKASGKRDIEVSKLRECIYHQQCEIMILHDQIEQLEKKMEREDC
jgi:hypothetical protein